MFCVLILLCNAKVQFWQEVAHTWLVHSQSAIWTNTFYILDIFIIQFGQVHFVFWIYAWFKFGQIQFAIWIPLYFFTLQRWSAILTEVAYNTWLGHSLLNNQRCQDCRTVDIPKQANSKCTQCSTWCVEGVLYYISKTEGHCYWKAKPTVIHCFTVWTTKEADICALLHLHIWSHKHIKYTVCSIQCNSFAL